MRLKSPTGFALWMGLRYVHSRNRGVGRLINWVSLVGLVLGIALLTVVVAVQNGLAQQSEQWIVDSVPHAIVPAKSVTPSFTSRLQAMEEVESVEPFVELYAFITIGRLTSQVVVYGVDSLAEYLQPSSRRSLEALTEDTPFIGIINDASYWYLRNNETFSLIFPVSTSRGVISKSATFRTVRSHTVLRSVPGESSMVVFVRVGDLVQLGVLGSNQIDQRITLMDPWRADFLFSDDPAVRTWSQKYRDYFRAINMEKSILFVLLTFVIALACLNIVSGQAMLINSKKTDIAILRTMGAEPKLLRLAFAIHGILIAIVGIVIGLVVGICISGSIVDFLQLLVDWRVIDGFEISGLHPFVQTGDILLTLTVSFTIACLAAIRPLSLVLRTNPIDALHSPA